MGIVLVPSERVKNVAKAAGYAGDDGGFACAARIIVAGTSKHPHDMFGLLGIVADGPAKRTAALQAIRALQAAAYAAGETDANKARFDAFLNATKLKSLQGRKASAPRVVAQAPAEILALATLEAPKTDKRK